MNKQARTTAVTGTWNCQQFLNLLAVTLLGITTWASNPSLQASNAASGLHRGPSIKQERVIDSRQILCEGVTYFTNVVDGQVFSRTNHYIKLTGNRYKFDKTSGKWQISQPSFQITPDGAVSTGTPHSVMVKGNIAQESAISVTGEDGTVIKSTPVLLSLSDGQNVVELGTIQPSIGQLVASNIIIFPDCFAPTKADVRIVLNPSGVEVDIVLKEQLPFSPNEVGLNPEKTHLEVVTEFFETAPPVITGYTGWQSSTNANNSLPDATLNFGKMVMGRGQTFLTEDELVSQRPGEVKNGLVAGKNSRPVTVKKNWRNEGGRDFLIESTPWREAKDKMKNLRPSSKPGPAVQTNSSSGSLSVNKGLARLLPSWSRSNESKKQMIMAKASLSGPIPGLVLDYNLQGTISGGFTFLGNTTYYINGGGTSVDLRGGLVTFEPGTVLKYDGYEGTTLLVDEVKCLGEPYRPVTLTSYEDDSIGELTGGMPNGFDGVRVGCPMLWIQGAADLQYLHIKNSSQGIVFDWSTYYYTKILRHCQFSDCYSPITLSCGNLSLQNVLFYNCSTVFTAWDWSNLSECINVTVHLADQMSDGVANVNYVNSLVWDVGGVESGAFGDHSYAGTGEYFQTAGFGRHYLPDGSDYINAGTANIPEPLKSDLKKKTTHAPTILTSMTGTLNTQVARDDKEFFDVGYHYEPLDYLASDIQIGVDQEVSLGGGTVVGLLFGTNTGAIQLGYNSKLSSLGDPQKPNYFVMCSSVQEGVLLPSGVNPQSGKYAITIPLGPAILDARWTIFPMQNGWWGTWAVKDSFPPDMVSTLTFSNCQFYGGTFDNYVRPLMLILNNDLLEDVTVYIRGLWNPNPSIQTMIQNCTFVRGNYQFTKGTQLGTYIKIYDSMWYCATVTGSEVESGHNGYYGTPVLPPTGIERGDVDMNNWSSFEFQKGPLGNYYWPIAYREEGYGGDTSHGPGVNGLFHFTTRIDQEKDGATPYDTDIGFHYIALNPPCAQEDILILDNNSISSPTGFGTGDGEPWFQWCNFPATPPYGDPVGQAHFSPLAAGTHQHWFVDYQNSRIVQEGDTLYAYVYLDPNKWPTCVMVQWHANDSSGWDNHRFYWGNNPPWPGTKIGEMSELTSGWNLLAIPASTIDMVGRPLCGVAFTLVGGEAVWGKAGRMTTIQPMSPADEDHDDLPDYVEDANGNGIVDTGETSFMDADTDWDGRSDGQEVLLDQTDPLSPYDVLPFPLGTWLFDDILLKGQYGQLPILAENVQSARSWQNSAVQVDNPEPAQLKYLVREMDGRANLGLDQGTVSFWFRPNWSSNSRTGPSGRLLELASPSLPEAGWWSLSVGPAGNFLEFHSAFNGVDTMNIGGPIDWSAGQWHQIVLTYGAEQTKLYVDAVLMTLGPGIHIQGLPDMALNIGSNGNGQEQAKGSYDFMETFNYVLTPTEIAQKYNMLRTIDSDEDGLPDIDEDGIGTNPFNPDTDGDWLNDGLEVNVYGTDPLQPDTDGDGLTDGDEVLYRNSLPLVTDSNNDGIPDGADMALPLQDVDNDTIPDVWELYWFGNQEAYEDFDGDGVANLYEYYLGTDPTLDDTDGDGTPDHFDDNRVVPSTKTDTIWFDGETGVPTAEYTFSYEDSWRWLVPGIYPVSGSACHVSSSYSGLHYHGYGNAATPMAVDAGDVLVSYVYLYPNDMPISIVLEWTCSDNFVARACWGAECELLGEVVSAGELPPAGKWVRLEVPASVLGLEGRQVNGMNFALDGGWAMWDHTGKYKSDSDGDGLLDEWEYRYFLDLSQTGDDDYDLDHLSNMQEYLLGTDPTNSDTDGDGHTDWQEMFDNTDPLNAASWASWSFVADHPYDSGAMQAANIVGDELLVGEMGAAPSPTFLVTEESGIIYGTLVNGVEGYFYDVWSSPTFNWPYYNAPWAWNSTVQMGAKYRLMDSSISQYYYFSPTLIEDPDGDHLPSGFEYFILKTETGMLNPDSDNNGLNDDLEDYDHNGVDNYHEYWRPQRATVYTAIPQASQAGGYGAFVVTIPKEQTANQNVGFTLGGTAATSGYSLKDSAGDAVSGKVTIPAGQKSAIIYVVPNSASAFVGTKTVSMTLTDANTTFGAPVDKRSAVVTIIGNGLPTGIYAGNLHPTLSVTAENVAIATMTEGGSGNYPFKITRAQAANDLTKKPLVVRYHLGGTAKYGATAGGGADYWVAYTNSVTIPVGEESTWIQVYPWDDTETELPETVVLTLEPSLDYELDSTKSRATVTIWDNEPTVYSIEKVQDGYETPLQTPGGPWQTANSLGRPAVMKILRKGQNSLTSPSPTVKVELRAPQEGYAVPINDYLINFECEPLTAWSSTKGRGPLFSFTFPVGCSSAQVACVPIKDGIIEGPETIRLEITPQGQGVIPFTDATIQDFDSMACMKPSGYPEAVSIDVSTLDRTAVVGTDDKASFRFLREGWFLPHPIGTYQDLTVYFHIWGQAAAGVDYTVSSRNSAYPVTQYDSTLFSITLPYNLEFYDSYNNWSPIIDISAVNCPTPNGVASIIVCTAPSSGPWGQNPFAALRLYEVGAGDIIPDIDGDGINDLNDTSPLTPDATGPNGIPDGIPDGYTWGDHNGDGIGNEWFIHPVVTYSDGDGQSDFGEIGFGTNPANPSSYNVSGSGPTITLTQPYPNPPVQ